MIRKKIILPMICVFVLTGCAKDDKEPEQLVQVEIEQISDITTKQEETVTGSGTDALKEAEAEAGITPDAEPEADTEEVDENENGTEDETGAKNETGADNETESAGSKTAQTDNDPKVIKIATIGSTSKEIVEKAAQAAGYYGYEVQNISCNDYDEPNRLVLEGTADACLYENEIYLDGFNKRYNSELAVVEKVYYEPLAVFGGTVSSIAGMSACKIAVPMGEVNLARALHLLEQKGIIELSEDAGYLAGMDAIASNPFGVTIEQVDMDSQMSSLAGYGLFVVDYNRAALAGIDPKTALGYENRNSRVFDEFAICLVTAGGKTNSMKMTGMSKILNSREVEDFIRDSYYGSVIDYR
ncbi:MAG: hypothetical protein K6G69_03420 [Lachnospiraceae bacterium]|nr:hypothetical protein [Lachnospiraceae bacterium]